jgi:bacterioferritin-associated ferredoxin
MFNSSCMYVCICKGVTDQDIDAAVSAGASSPSEVMAVTGAGSRCGTCRHSVEQMVDERLDHADAHAGCPRSRRRLSVVPASAA